MAESSKNLDALLDTIFQHGSEAGKHMDGGEPWAADVHKKDAKKAKKKIKARYESLISALTEIRRVAQLGPTFPAGVSLNRIAELADAAIATEAGHAAAPATQEPQQC